MWGYYLPTKTGHESGYPGLNMKDVFTDKAGSEVSIYVDNLCQYMYMHIFIYIYLPTSEAKKVEQNIHTYIYLHIYIHIYIYSSIGQTDKSNGNVSICVDNFKCVLFIYTYTYLLFRIKIGPAR